MLNPVAGYLARLHARHADARDGAVADYIPELSRADPDAFGICVATTGGAVHEAGDTGVGFTIQSISKPLTFGRALDDLGEERVRRHVGVEPTGESFNAITLDHDTGTPLNPMVNAGAIATASLVRDRHGDGAERALLDTYSRYAGRGLAVDEDVYRSELATGHRNRAIAHLMRGSGAVAGDPEEALRLYFRQCSVLVDCRDLALVAATLANGGVNPVTGERAASRDAVRGVLAVMATCGMYDGAGEWMYTVGLPAKSGVAGGIIAVVPGRLGIAVHSPRLDAHGNSVRGVRVCQDLAREQRLHMARPDRGAPPVVRSEHTIAEVGSKRVRPEAQVAALADAGRRAVWFELSGEVAFAAAEAALRAVGAVAGSADLVVLDLHHARRVAPSVVPLLAELGHGFADLGAELILSGTAGHDGLVDALEAGSDGVRPWRPRVFADLDLALEWCEDRLLEARSVPATMAACTPDEHPLLEGLPAPARDAVRGLLTRRSFPRGTTVLEPGRAADELLLVLGGEMSVILPAADGTPRRLATISPGMVLGALTLFGGLPGDELVHADTDVACAVLSRADMEELRQRDPASVALLLEGLLRGVGLRAQRLRAELLHQGAAVG